jgi:hypothetical protein
MGRQVLKNTDNLLLQRRINFKKWDQSHCVDDMRGRDIYSVENLRKAPSGAFDGTTIFVYTDCETRLPLPMDQQKSSIYKMPGVALSHVQHASLYLEGYNRQQVL